MKKKYETPSVYLKFVTKEDILLISLDQLFEEEIPGVMWEG